MRKVAIVGVEGSGKTVMLAGLGDLYSRPDANGCFLGPKNFQTATYVADKIARMRRGEWPMATAEDVMQGLDWTLRQRQGEGQRPRDLCEVSCLDFAGEVYRYAFVREEAVPVGLMDEVESLKAYVRNADDLIVLINLRDIIVRGQHEPRVQEAMWITNAILSYALDERDGRKAPRAMIVLSQADSYAETIRSCRGPKGVLAKYLPHVANNYDWLDIMAVSAVDRTVLDENGNTVPAPDFQSTPLRAVMDWIRDGVDMSVRRRWPAPPSNPSGHHPPAPPSNASSRPPPAMATNPFILEPYFSLRGRKSREQYWHFFLFAIVACFCVCIFSPEDDFGLLGLFFLAMAWPCVSNIVRRLHDINRSGWLGLLCCIPLAGLIAIVAIGAIEGSDGDNKYGPKP